MTNDWIQEQERQERFEHEAVQNFCDYVKSVGLDCAILKVLRELDQRELETRRRFEDSAGLDVL